MTNKYIYLDNNQRSNFDSKAVRRFSENPSNLGSGGMMPPGASLSVRRCRGAGGAKFNFG